MISSRADFLFFSVLESEADDVSFRFADAAAVLRALLLRVELQEVADIQIVKVCVSFFSRAATNHYVVICHNYHLLFWMVKPNLPKTSQLHYTVVPSTAYVSKQIYQSIYL